MYRSWQPPYCIVETSSQFLFFAMRYGIDQYIQHYDHAVSWSDRSADLHDESRDKLTGSFQSRFVVNAVYYGQKV